MATGVPTSQSIEGERVYAFGRKILPDGLPKIDGKTRKIRFCISIRKGGGGRIEKAFDPKVAHFWSNSKVDVGDEIRGFMLEGSSHKKFGKGDEQVGGARTHTHSGQSWTMEGECALRVVLTFLKQPLTAPTPQLAPTAIEI
ncbi:MAG: hypothetical protein Q7S40_06370 [Opitutaceae bacterium]|nr:hypothetical protein [Opitutaceae bacterium]